MRGEDKLILWAIAHRREQNEREEWTKLPFDQMAGLTGLSERTCQRRVKKLRECKILKTHSDKGGNGNRYAIDLQYVPLHPKKQRARGPKGRYDATEAFVKLTDSWRENTPPVKGKASDPADIA